MRRFLVYIWTAPTTLVGLVVVALGLFTGGRARVVDGAIEAHGGLIAFLLRRCVPLPGGASAMALGHVVLGVDRPRLDATRVHERVHVRQAERWGPLFIPAYLIASCLAWLRGRDAYRDNPFEREAYDRPI